MGPAGVLRRWRAAHRVSLMVLIQGIQRVRVPSYASTDPYLMGTIEPAPDQLPDLRRAGAAGANRAAAKRGAAISAPGWPGEPAPGNGRDGQSARRPTADGVSDWSRQRASISRCARSCWRGVLDTKLQRLSRRSSREIEILEIGQRIQTEAQTRMTKAQREYFLREQLKAIQRELGEDDPRTATRAASQADRGCPADGGAAARGRARARAHGVVPSVSPERGIIRTYLDWMASLPWTRDGRRDRRAEGPGRCWTRTITTWRRSRSGSSNTWPSGSSSRTAGAAGMSWSKTATSRRRRRTPQSETPTDRGDARADPVLGRAAGRWQDEPRAVDRTGAWGGNLCGSVWAGSAMRPRFAAIVGRTLGRCRADHPGPAARRDERPVFMLDELDKLTVGFQGDPAAALLEVLDPSQNSTFEDNYLGVPFDLSRVLFVCTANVIQNVPGPLLDRIEVLEIPGYTDDEKILIAEHYLVERQRRANGLRSDEVEFSRDALRHIVRDYTREAGVRDLERQIGSILRKVAREVAVGRDSASGAGATATLPVTIPAERVTELLGQPRFTDETLERIDRPGVVTGLAWTPVGGDILFVEAAILPGQSDRLIVTGQLGDVMRESVQAALTYLQSSAESYGLDPKMVVGRGVHVHVPAGAIPKDGPSTGCHHAHRAGLGDDRPSRAARFGDDRGDNPARQGPARRRHQREGHGGASRWHQDRAPPAP